MIGDSRQLDVSSPLVKAPSAARLAHRRGRMPARCLIVMAVVAFLFVAGSLPATAADDFRAITNKLTFSFGSYLADFDTDASVGTDGVLGTFIRFEDELGLDDDDTIFRIDGFYRFSDKNAIGFGFWTLNRDGEAFTSEQINFDGDIFDVGVFLRSELDSQWIRLDWRHSFLRNEKGEAGFTLGLSTYEFDVGLQGLATVSDGMGGTVLVDTRSSDDFLAPVPTIGFFINYSITPKWVFRLSANYFSLEVSDFEGNITDTVIQFEWLFSRYVGVGVAVNGTIIDVEDTGDDPFSVKYDQSGLVAFLTFGFGSL